MLLFFFFFAAFHNERVIALSLLVYIRFGCSYLKYMAFLFSRMLVRMNEAAMVVACVRVCVHFFSMSLHFFSSMLVCIYVCEYANERMNKEMNDRLLLLLLLLFYTALLSLMLCAPAPATLFFRVYLSVRMNK